MHNFIISIVATILAIFSYIMLLNFAKYVHYSEENKTFNEDNRRSMLGI